MVRRLLRKLLVTVACWGIIVFSLRCLHFFDRDKIKLGRPDQASVPNLSKPSRPSIPLEPAQHRIQSLRETPPESSIVSTLTDDMLAPISTIQPESLTAIMPLSAASLAHLNETLAPLLFKTSCLQQLILVCPEDILQQARRATRQIIYSISLEVSYPELLVRPYRPQAHHETTPTLHAISEIMTDWILVLDENGLNTVNSQARRSLLNPSSFQLPVGPKCDDYCHFVADELHLSSFSLRTQGPHYTPVTALVPPFVISAALLKDQVNSLNGNINSWQRLGLFVASRERNGIGGLLMSSTEDETLHHQIQTTGPFRPELTVGKDETLQPGLNSVDTAAHKHHFSFLQKAEKNTRSGLIAIILPSYSDLSAFSRAACGLKKNNDLFLRILLYSHVAPLASEHKQSNHGHGTCLLDYDSIAPEDENNVARSDSFSILVQQWLGTLEILPDVVITTNAIEISHVTASPLIILPSEDLIICEWVGSLSLLELSNWYSPRFTISIITKDRPQSLNRLLSSIASAKYYGDRVSVRLNMEQSSDEDTQALVRSFQWPHGEVFAHRRVVHAGLLPAVVESWYPRTDDEYGILLEDDVEVSPMFYAWAKMAVLRYRYGSLENRSPRLFGVSLYQQKVLELRQQGRTVFNAKAVFHKEGLHHVATPYLSSIPCSWGAVYFPDHWREFHDYLAIRLSEYALSLEEDIVPNVRSNKWSKSWKKFFIELAYLRGYVMVYPNYPHHVSLATNHLEVGAHVKEMPLDMYRQRKAMFSVPLMQLPAATDPPSSLSSLPSLSASVGILELPDRTLPRWREMPVLDFGGSVSSLDDLMEVGLARRALLSGCAGVESWPLEGAFDVLDLLCIQRAT